MTALVPHGTALRILTRVGIAYKNRCGKSSGLPTPGRVPEWTKGADCKSVIRRFESDRGL